MAIERAMGVRARGRGVKGQSLPRGRRLGEQGPWPEPRQADWLFSDQAEFDQLPELLCESWKSGASSLGKTTLSGRRPAELLGDLRE